MTAFAIALALSAAAGLFWLAWAFPDGRSLSESEQGVAFRLRFDMGLWVLAGGFLGARIAFVFLHLGYYAAQPLESLMIWQGGLSWPGAAAGALLTLYLYALITKQSFWDLVDMLAAPAALLAVGLWAGCLLDRSVYGLGGQSGPLAVASADIFGVVSRRWPTQILGAACSALILLGALLLRGRLPRAGLLAGITLSLLAAMMLTLSFTRGDPVGILWGVRLDTLGSALILAVGLSGLALRIWRK